MSEVLSIGVDLCDIARIERALMRPNFRSRVYTPGERETIERRGVGGAQTAAAMFAAKEAAAKALGTGFSGGVALCDFEVVHAPGGAPSLRVCGEALRRMAALGGRRFCLSLSHEGTMAVAMVVLVGEPKEALC